MHRNSRREDREPEWQRIIVNNCIAPTNSGKWVLMNPQNQKALGLGY